MDYNAKIDAEKRWIILPKGFMIGVKSDDNVTRINFTCPKIVGNDLDLTQSSVRINFKNAGGQSDAYIVSDVAESDDGNVTFSWLVGRKMMMYYGPAYFIICVKRTTEDGTIIQEWNTGLAVVNVLEGIEPEGINDEPEIDIISKLLLLAQEANTNAQTNIDQSEKLIEQSTSLLEKAEEISKYSLTVDSEGYICLSYNGE